MIRVEAKRYDTVTPEPWWHLGRIGLSRTDGFWLLLVTGRSVRHPHRRGWYVTVEPVR